ncbi:MAG TPA: AMP-binding protein [Chloroflexota bacterium]|nr:AMP-binding protein [Chloroflexota bacterium]
MSEVQRTRAYAYAHSQFFKEFHRGATDAPLHEVPSLTKPVLMEHYDEVATDPRIRLEGVRDHLDQLKRGSDELLLGEYRLCATSGSTGNPGLFIYNQDEWLWVLSGFWRSMELIGNSLNLTRRTRLAAIGSRVPYHPTRCVADALHSWWSPEMRLDVTAPIEELVDGLNQWSPEILISYPSVASKLAAEQIAGRLRITPRRVVTGAEPMWPEWRAAMEAAWGKCVHDEYGATEPGAVATECEEHHGLHLAEDLFVCEVVDADNRPVPDGEIGEKALLTMFHRTTLPLIRYEMSDCLQLSPEPCPCGRPTRLIESIQGRIEDLVPVPGQHGGLVGIRPVAINGVMEAAPVTAWQLQAEDGRLTLLLAELPLGYDESSIERELNAVFQKQGGALTPILVRRVERIPRGSTGKTVPIVIKNPLPRSTTATA